MLFLLIACGAEPGPVADTGECLAPPVSVVCPWDDEGGFWYIETGGEEPPAALIYLGGAPAEGEPLVWHRAQTVVFEAGAFVVEPDNGIAPETDCLAYLLGAELDAAVSP